MKKGIRGWNNLYTCITPSLYLNQCWLFVKLDTTNIFQQNSNQNTTIIITQKCISQMTSEMAAILSRLQFVKSYQLRPSFVSLHIVFVVSALFFCVSIMLDIDTLQYEWQLCIVRSSANCLISFHPHDNNICFVICSLIRHIKLQIILYAFCCKT